MSGGVAINILLPWIVQTIGFDDQFLKPIFNCLSVVVQHQQAIEARCRLTQTRVRHSMGNLLRS